MNLKAHALTSKQVVTSLSSLSEQLSNEPEAFAASDAYEKSQDVDQTVERNFIAVLSNMNPKDLKALVWHTESLCFPIIRWCKSSSYSAFIAIYL